MECYFYLSKLLVQKGTNYHKDILNFIRNYIANKYKYHIFLISVNSQQSDIISPTLNDLAFWDINLIKDYSSIIDTLNSKMNILIMEQKSNIFYNVNDVDINENYAIFHGMKVLYLDMLENISKINNNSLNQTHDIIYQNYVFDIKEFDKNQK